MGNGPSPITGAADNFTASQNSRCTLFSADSEDYKCHCHCCKASLCCILSTCVFLYASCDMVIPKVQLFGPGKKMILSLTVAALFDSIAYLMGEVIPDGVLCNFQAWWLTYFDWCSLAWVCCITVNLYFNLVKEIRTDRFAVWITDDHVAWRFGIWYIPLFVLIFLMMSCYIHIFYVAKRRVLTWSGPYDPERERSKILLTLEIKPLKWYPSVYLAVSLFPLINRLHNAFDPSHPVFVLTLLHVITAPLHGLANAIVFGFDRETWSQLNLTSLQLAFQSRFSDTTLIKEYQPGPVRYMAHLESDSSDSCDDGTGAIYSSTVTSRDRRP
ncbi:G-protein coupled receptor 1 isoform X3 [Carcharodon carcharias]|uniref:G-protein coupled receptor 1 isoform X3 n=1 Tax=Carcharodon carcharias TaxID=13397 RepID=UPI001B7E7749|nr:G-protein coupled receptor 1 isoform X3 [Carcharodon carcharias]